MMLALGALSARVMACIDSNQYLHQGDLMKILTMRHSFAVAAFLLALSIGPPLIAQTRVRVNTPGTTFSPEGPVAPGVVQDGAGGRRFRGKAGELLMLRAVLRMPSASSAEPIALCACIDTVTYAIQ